MSTDTKWEELRAHVDSSSLENLIQRTPSGPTRNMLTDLRILLDLYPPEESLLGEWVKDKESALEGKVLAETKHLYGEDQLVLVPNHNHKDKAPVNIVLPRSRVRIIK